MQYTKNEWSVSNDGSEFKFLPFRYIEFRRLTWVKKELQKSLAIPW